MEVEVLVNCTYGGLSISEEALRVYNARCEARGLEAIRKPYGVRDHRSNPLLLEIVRELGAAANGRHARLWIYKGIQGYYGIQEYDGLESFEACASEVPHLDVRALVFDDTQSAEEKVRQIRDAYTEHDRIMALADALDKQNPVYKTEIATGVLDPMS